MTKTVFTTVTPIPPGVSRQTVMETLHDHLAMIDLNPSHEERHRVNPPPEASAEEYHCTWYEITDKVSYLPAGMYSGKVKFKACFHDLVNGLQTHVYAPMGIDIKEKWTLGGNMPGEPVMPVEIGFGVPISGLYLREDVVMKCNFLMTKFVRNTLKDSLAKLVARLAVKAQLEEANIQNRRLTYDPTQQFTPPLSPPLTSPRTSPHSPSFNMAYAGASQGSVHGSPQPTPSAVMPQVQYAKYNPAAYAPVYEVDATARQSPGFPNQSPGHPPGPAELA